jgi:Leucine-rich repeat (LRR) protein
MNCSNNSLASLDVSGLPNLAFLSCDNNALTSLRAVGVGALTEGQYYSAYSYTGGLHLRNNNLSAAALNQFYTDLATTGEGLYPGILLVSGNPGTAGDNTSIATAKNWTVYGS